MSQSNLSTVIKLCANRVRCSNCNSVSSKALFLSKPVARVRSSFFRSGGPSMIRKKHVLVLNGMKTLDTQMSLIRLCMICGETREMNMKKP